MENDYILPFLNTPHLITFINRMGLGLTKCFIALKRTLIPNLCKQVLDYALFLLGIASYTTVRVHLHTHF